ncbi:MAG: preprotein translocase subunit SecG [Spirochaetales bacterium]|nr:preprotein translocase subunit SecG [Spirochaetales bacterium]
MDIIFLILIILSAILLVIIVMMQDEQGEGLGGIFGGGSSTPFGSRSGNVLTRITAILAVVFLLSTLGLAFMKRTPTESRGAVEKSIEDMYESSSEELWFADVEEKTKQDEESTLEMPMDDESVFTSDTTPGEGEGE